MACSVKITAQAEKGFDDLSSTVRPRIAEALRGLGDNSRLHGCKKLRADLGWSYRIGDYRIIYLVDDEAHAVSLTWIGPRGGAYRSR